MPFTFDKEKIIDVVRRWKIAMEATEQAKAQYNKAKENLTVPPVETTTHGSKPKAMTLEEYEQTYTKLEKEKEIVEHARGEYEDRGRAEARIRDELLGLIPYEPDILLTVDGISYRLAKVKDDYHDTNTARIYIEQPKPETQQ